MEEAIIVVCALFYIVIAIMTHKIVYMMLINDLNCEDPKDRELLEDRRAINLVIGAASVLWILYIPYLCIMSFITTRREMRKF